jgi:hypothetical protein
MHGQQNIKEISEFPNLTNNFFSLWLNLFVSMCSIFVYIILSSFIISSPSIKYLSAWVFFVYFALYIFIFPPENINAGFM